MTQSAIVEKQFGTVVKEFQVTVPVNVYDNGRPKFTGKQKIVEPGKTYTAKVFRINGFRERALSACLKFMREQNAVFIPAYTHLKELSQTIKSNCDSDEGMLCPSHTFYSRSFPWLGRPAYQVHLAKWYSSENGGLCLVMLVD